MLKDELKKMSLKPVRPLVYPGTYAVIKAASMMAEDVTNRSSASWKKAEHIFFDNIFADRGKSLLAYWMKFAQSNFEGAGSSQSLYVPIGRGEYVKYNGLGEVVAQGRIGNIIEK